MITGFQEGTQIKWNRENVLTTGVVKRVFRKSQDIELNGEQVHVEVSEHSPSYLVEHYTGDLVILPHTEVMLKEMNAHT